MTEPTADRSYRALFAVPSVGRVLLGMTIARVGGTAVSIAMVLFTLSHYGSPALAGLVTFASIFPGLLLAPIAGALLDRHGRKRLVILDYVVAACSMWLIGGLALANALPPILLVLIAAASSLTAPLSLVGLRSLLPILVPSHLWERANAIDSNGYVIATLLGPPAAGALVGIVGGPIALIVIGGTFVLAALVLLRMPDPETNVATSGSLLQDAWDGLRYTFRNPSLRALALSISTANLGGGMTQIVVPVIVLTRLHESPLAVGGVWAAAGLAGMLSALLFGRIDTRGREKQLLVWPQFVVAGAIALLLVSPSLPVIVVAFVISGLMNGPVDIALFTVRQRRTEPTLMGRAFATSMAMNFFGFPVGSAISGALVDVTLAGTILFGVAAFAGAGLFAWLFLPADHPAESGLEDVSGTPAAGDAPRSSPTRATAGTRRP